MASIQHKNNKNQFTIFGGTAHKCIAIAPLNNNIVKHNKHTNYGIGKISLNFLPEHKNPVQNKTWKNRFN